MIATTYDSVGTMAVNVERAASIPFAASGEHYTSLVHGRAKIKNPPGTTNRLNRRNFTGTKVAQKGAYDPARQLGHLPILLLHEVTGALHPESYRFLHQMAEMHDNNLPYGLRGQSWTVQTFTTYFLQRLSSAVTVEHGCRAGDPRPDLLQRPPALGCTQERGRQAVSVLCARGTLSEPRHAPPSVVRA